MKLTEEIKLQKMQEAKKANEQAIREWIALHPDGPATVDAAFAIADGLSRGLPVSEKAYETLEDWAEKEGLSAKTELEKAKAIVEDRNMWRIFEHYKQDLIRLHRANRHLRMLTIEYVCRVPKIDPFYMAQSLVKDGYHVVFDDSSMSPGENERKRKKVYGKWCTADIKS